MRKVHRKGTGSLYKKKSLGQHFLRDETDSKRIADLLELPKGTDAALEVGPGQGALTQYLIDKDFELFVSELDDRLIEELPKRFPALEGKVLAGDFLKAPLDMLPDSFGLIGNFPYNISSQIVMRMVDERKRIPVMVGMFQREVGKRLCAEPGNRDYGVVTVLAQAWYKAEYCFELPPEAFDPPPKVHSAVIRMHRIDREPMANERLFRRVVKAAFSLRRKKLRNALRSVVPESWLEEPLFDRRAESLSVAEYEALTERLIAQSETEQNDHEAGLPEPQ